MSSKNRNWPGSKGPSRRSTSVRAATQAAIAQPTVRGRSARYGSARSRSLRGSAAGGMSAGRSAPSVPGSGCAERWTAPSASSRRGTQRRSAPAAAAAASRSSDPSSSSQSGLSRTVTACRARSTPALLAAPNPGLAPSSTTSAPAARASSAPSSLRGGVDHDQLRRLGEQPQRVQQRGQRPAESCSTTTTENVIGWPPPRAASAGPAARRGPGRAVTPAARRASRHAPAASASTARVRRAVSAQLSGAIASRPAASNCSRSAGSAATRSSASARPAASPGVDVERAAAEHLAQHGEVADDRGRAGGDALDRRQAEALEPRWEHDGERAGVERAEVLDVPEPPHPARLDVDAAVARHDQLRLQPALARDPEARHQHVRALARLERADREEVGVRGGRGGAREPARRQRRGPHAVRLQAPLADQLAAHHLGVAEHARRPPREPPRAGRLVPGPLVAREVLRAHLPRAVVDGEDERGLRADRERRGRRGPHDVAVAEQRVEPRAAGRRRGGEQHPRRQRVPHRLDARRDRRLALRQQHPVLVVRVRRGEGLQQGGRIVRHPARPAADQAAPVDPDLHASCPVIASPSTPAPPRAPSSAASNAGRASSPPACPRCGPTRTRSSRRRRGSSTAPATRGSSSCCRCGRRARGRCCARPTSPRWRSRATSS